MHLKTNISLKNYFEKFIKYGLYALLGWYFLSLYVVLNDDTLDFGTKILGEVINYLMIIMLIRVLKYQYTKANFTDFSVIFMLIFWFFYSTYRDFNDNGYDFLLKMFYVAIDLFSTVFSIDTFVNFMLNSNLFLFSKEDIKSINDYMKIFLCVTFSYIYFNIYRSIK